MANPYAVRESAAEILLDAVDQRIEEIELQDDSKDITEWISDSRVIFGENWSWEYARISIEPSEVDKKNLDLIEEKGRFYLKRAPRPYLIAYINDEIAQKAVIKCRQSEFSESEINSNLFYVCNYPYFNARHLFPTATVGRQMAKEKITIAIEESEKIRRRMVPPNNLSEKKTDRNSFYTIAGAFNEFGGRGPSADRIVFDEYNFHNPKIKAIYESSTDHSKYHGQKVYISTPTFPNMGIDDEYMAGCQYEWHVTCPKCKKEQQLLFPDNIINFIEKGDCPTAEEENRRLEKTYIGCRYCHTYIDRTAEEYERNSRFIAMRPEMEGIYHSYRVTGFMTAWRTGKDMNRRYLRMRFEQQFWNEVVGYANIGDSTKVTDSDFSECVDSGYRNIFRRLKISKNISVGIDWGQVESWLVVVGDGMPPDPDEMRVLLAFRISNDTLKKYGFNATSDEHVNLAMKIIDSMDADIIVNDANGIGIRDNAKLYKKYKSRSFGAMYDTEPDKLEYQNRRSVIIKWSETDGIVTIPRAVELIDTMDLFIDREIKVPKIETYTMQLFKEHIMSLASSFRMNERTGAVFVIVGHTGPDHFAHALNYAKVGYRRIKDGKNPREKRRKLRASKGQNNAVNK